MQFQIGDHLVTPRRGYDHHGIYIGHDKVIHYSGLANGLNAGPVEVTTVQIFAAGREVTVRQYDTSLYSGEHAVARAHARLGEDRYDLHANNCEHFCSWVRTGTHVSNQVEFVEELVGAVGSVVGEFRKQRFHQATVKEAVVESGRAAVKSIAKGNKALLMGGLGRLIK